MTFLRGLFSRDTPKIPDISQFISDTQASSDRARQELKRASDNVKYLKNIALDPPPFERDMFPREAKNRTER